MKNINALIRISYEVYLKCKTQSLPADPYQIARQLNIAIKEAQQTDIPHYEAMGDDVALLAWEKERYCIYLKSQNGSARNPIFHELAHVQLKHLSDGPPQEDEANLLMMLQLVPPIFLRMYKGDKLGFIQMLSGVTEAEAKRYLLTIIEFGFRNCKTQLDAQMLLQFDEYIKTSIRPAQKRQGLQIAALGLMLALGIVIGTVFLPLNSGEGVPEVTFPNVITNSPAGNELTELSKTVYINPTGEKYHYSPNCAGVNAVDIPLDKALALMKAPCLRCVFDSDD